jgi:hypothetical protein
MVRFSCGCIAVSDETIHGKHIILYSCDSGNESPHSFYLRDMGDKERAPISDEKASGIVEEIGKLVGDGERLRSIKAILRT